MLVSDLCPENLVCVESHATLRFASCLMKKEGVSTLVVIQSNKSRKPIGLLTDRDIVLSVVAGTLPLNTKVSQVMSKKFTTLLTTEDVAEAIRVMDKDGSRRLIAVDEFGNACGLLSAENLFQLLAHEMSHTPGAQQAQVIEDAFLQDYRQLLLPKGVYSHGEPKHAN